MVDERTAAGGDAAVVSGGEDTVSEAVSAGTDEAAVSSLATSPRRASAAWPEVGVGACSEDGDEACPSFGGRSARDVAACILANCDSRAER